METWSDTRSERVPLFDLARRASVWLLLASPALAQEVRDEWEFRAALYGFFPHIGGSATLPTGTSSELDVDAEDLLENLEFAGMASFAAQHGRWGFFSDVIYLDVADSVDDTTSLAAGGLPLPPGITADAEIEVQGWVWTTAASYRAVATEADTFDVFGGARLLAVESELEYEFSGDFGPFVGPARNGTGSSEVELWDAVAGLKGRHALGASARWFVPYYLDLGTGESDLTWQAAAGIGCSLPWGELFATYRYLSYDFDSGERLEDLDFRGPALGVAFNL